MTKEKNNAVKNAILIAAAEKLIDLHFSIDPEDLRDNMLEIFEMYMIGPYSNDQVHRETAHLTLTSVRQLADVLTDLYQNIEVWQQSV